MWSVTLLDSWTIKINSPVMLVRHFWETSWKKLIHWFTEGFLNGEYIETVCFVTLTWRTPRADLFWEVLSQNIFSLPFFFLRQNVLSPLFRIVFNIHVLSPWRLLWASYEMSKTQCKLKFITAYIIPDLMISTSEVGTQIQVHSILWFFFCSKSCALWLLYLELF